jgi:hypothetical protein
MCSSDSGSCEHGDETSRSINEGGVYWLCTAVCQAWTIQVRWVNHTKRDNSSFIGGRMLLWLYKYAVQLTASHVMFDVLVWHSVGLLQYPVHGCKIRYAVSISRVCVYTRAWNATIFTLLFARKHCLHFHLRLRNGNDVSDVRQNYLWNMSLKYSSIHNMTSIWNTIFVSTLLWMRVYGDYSTQTRRWSPQGMRGMW